MSNFKLYNKAKQFRVKCLSTVTVIHPQPILMRHSIVLEKENSEFYDLEIKSIKDLRNTFVKSNLIDFKFNFVKSTGTMPLKNEADKLLLIPFFSKDQLNQFERDDSTVFIVKMTQELFGILCSNFCENLFDSFLNREPIEIESIYFGLPSKDSVILPTCPVCIKRLDKSISGLNVIKCRDLFHSCCRENCRKLSRNCRVCSLIYDDDRQTMNCSDCTSTENLWICLICGNLGCGRYKGGHAHNHFLKTGHAFALKSDSQLIWDYTLDKYVHWSIKSAEGTIVDVDEDLKSETRSVREVLDNNEPAFVDEFTTAQLESQKAFFEERLLAMKKETQQELLHLKQAKDEEIRFLKEELSRTNHERKILHDLSNQLKEHSKKVKKEATDMKMELDTEKRIGQGLCRSIDDLNNELETVNAGKTELEEQVKDLMKHLEVIDLMGKAGNDPDIVEGKLVIRSIKKKNTK